MAKKGKAKFSCAQMEFVSAANLGWLLFEHYMADFSDLKRLYKLSTAHEARAPDASFVASRPTTGTDQLDHS